MIIFQDVRFRCLEKTRSDYVEFSNFNIQLIDRKMKRFCGEKHQHFVSTVSSDGSFFRVTFRSNDVFEATGFEAFYQFRTFQGTTTQLAIRVASASLTVCTPEPHFNCSVHLFTYWLVSLTVYTLYHSSKSRVPHMDVKFVFFS